MKTAPSLKNPPSAMNPDAQSIWEHVIKKYADHIYDSKALREQWATARRLFERTCKQSDIPPYVEETDKHIHWANALERIARS
jgi:hypothetical protein